MMVTGLSGVAVNKTLASVCRVPQFQELELLQGFYRPGDWRRWGYRMNV